MCYSKKYPLTILELEFLTYPRKVAFPFGQLIFHFQLPGEQEIKQAILATKSLKELTETCSELAKLQSFLSQVQAGIDQFRYITKFILNNRPRAAQGSEE